ncbi:GNAT family N-acetyltransferase [Allofournierella sp.]|uniref:GNAT family N-acetyltransferase n=1 Tax=Allofournierella sp. TaxID=1940256 RepID=UPI002E769792|nr:GNAT family N-acetyltransferase [Fournierella sp.]MEE0755764.1 GNAT family N-acetyltransferase [Fournierella sp.]
MRHPGTVPLLTPRLSLAPLRAADAEEMFQNWAGDEAVARFMRWPAHKNSLETFQLLAAWECLYQSADYYNWGIRRRGDGALLGTIGFVPGEEQSPEAWRAPGLDFSAGVWEPGYCLGRAFWGQGYATEALAAVRDFWFDEVGGAWLGCCHAVENPASGRVMEKAGWRFDHAATCHKADGTPMACRSYCLKKEERQKRL